jgi:hypothetical protein
MASAELIPCYGLRMNRQLPAMVFGLALSLPSVAWAACEAPYTPEKLSEDLSTMSSTLRAAQPGAFQQAGQSLSTGLPCVSVPLAPMIIGSAYRYIGLSAYFGGREAEARGWFRSALELDSTFDWDVSEVSVDDPIRPVFEEERINASTEKVSVGAGVRLKILPGTRISSDGRPLTKPALTLDRPHLLQLINSVDNTVISVFLIDGNAIPDSLISSVAAPEVVAGAPAAGISVQQIARARPPLKTPSIITGAVLMAAGVGLYAASFSTRTKFDEASTLEAAKQHRTTTNTLVVSAGGALLAGAGLTYVGLTLDGRPSIRWSTRF